MRLFDHLKLLGITGLFTYLSAPRGLEETEIGVSSLIDTWIELRDLEHGGERNRVLHILKSRGMPHSNQVRELVITSHGIDLVDAFVGPEGVALGSARLTQEESASNAEEARAQGISARDRALARHRKVVAAQIEALRAELEADEDETRRAIAAHARREAQLLERRATMRQTKLGPPPEGRSSHRSGA